MLPKKILLADDSITIQKVVELTFSDGDYEVIATNNGTKAIELLDKFRPDIILSDIIMPEKNGYEVCEYVKSRPDLKHIPVILLTGTFEPFDPERAEKAGCDAVVTKPFESQGLIQKVEDLIKKHSASSAAAAPTIEEPTPSAGESRAPEASPFESAPEPAASPFEEAPPAPLTSRDEEEIFGTSAEAEEGGETKLIPRMTFEDLQRMRDTAQAPVSHPEPTPPEPAPVPPPLEIEQPSAFGGGEFEGSGETKLIPKMTFEDLQQMEARAIEPALPAMDASPFETEPPVSEESPFEAVPPIEEEFAPAAQPEDTSPFGFESEQPAPLEAAAMPMLEPEPEPEPAQPFEAPMEEPEPEPEPMYAPPALGATLSEGDMDRIARRVVELMSDKVVREVAWEVIPEMAEMAVRERIRELESEEDS